MPRTSKYTREILAQACESSYSLAEVIRKLSLKVGGGTQQYIKALIISHQINVDHFSGMGWANGKTRDSHPALDKMAQKLSRPDDEIFAKGSIVSTRELKKRLLRSGRPYECEECELKLWRDKKITLHLDHENGDHADNRRENLRFLCPNCHQQTLTWGRGNVPVKMLEHGTHRGYRLGCRCQGCRKAAHDYEVSIGRRKGIS